MKRSLLLGAVLLSACSSTSDVDPVVAPVTPPEASTTTTTPALEVDDVFDVPDPLPPGEPGEVIQVEPLGEVDGAPGSSAWRVLYHSRSIADEDIAVSGVIVRPGGEAPDGGFPVVAWAHGTTGTADICAPSRAAEDWVPSFSEALAAGYVVAATDYEGLGTPGLHPYLVGESEGRGVLDSVRAAGRLGGVDAGGSVVVWGHSQGGHAALFAGEIAARYAPDLDVLGVVAMAPAGDLSLIGRVALATPSIFGFGFMVLGTWAQEYPDLDLDQLLSPEALELLPLLDEVCTPEIFGALAGRTAEELVITSSPIDVPPLAELLAMNSIGVRPLSGPVLVVQGEADALVPPGLTQALLPQLCSAGADAELRMYPGADHGSIPQASSADVLAWSADRFAGAAVSEGCASP